jgi:hypothetical protein
MLRKILLSLLMLGSLVVMLPLVNSTAHNIKYDAVQRQRRVRKHSRAWWRRHHALIRRRRAARLRRLALAAIRRQANRPVVSGNHVAFKANLPAPAVLVRDDKAPVSSLPTGWLTTSAPGKGETNFRVVNPNGSSAGQAALSVVAAAAPPLGRVSAHDRARVLAGVSHTDLRRTVIDKMITAGGWVVNDLQRDINGRKVFIVVAQTPGTNDGREPERIWNFYFTEIGGRVYSLSTSADRNTSGRLASDAEKFLNSLPAMTPVAPRFR